jgi:DNA (cytosine-5)-methyltransferase 1
MWFVKARRAQSETDYESWVEGAVCTTLNVMDNTGDSRATVLILFEATRVDDVRIYDKYSPTVATYWGTGGSRVPYVYPLQGTMIGRSDTAGPNGKGFGNDGDPMYTVDTVSGHGVVTETFVRRLSPVDCERLQGFPDNWTEGGADSTRYKQMGNAVAVPVVSWIIDRLVRANDELV